MSEKYSPSTFKERRGLHINRYGLETANPGVMHSIECWISIIDNEVLSALHNIVAAEIVTRLCREGVFDDGEEE